MGYFEELRALIGHRPIIMVGAGVLVIDHQGRLLLGLRADNRAWGIPGGSMEPGETLEDTARRETREETGLELAEMTLFGVFSGPELFYTYPNGDQVYNVSVIFKTTQYRGHLRSNEEHRAFDFFAPGEIPEEISPPVRPVIRAWIAKAAGSGTG